MSLEILAQSPNLKKFGTLFIPFSVSKNSSLCCFTYYFIPAWGLKFTEKLVYKEGIYLYELSNKEKIQHKYIQELDPILPWLQWNYEDQRLRGSKVMIMKENKLIWVEMTSYSPQSPWYFRFQNEASYCKIGLCIWL